MELDQTWTAFSNFTANRESFAKQFLPEIFLNRQVNSNVVESFRVIKKLLEHSYFEYQFYDVAVLKSVLALEMALKIRYKEINAVDWNNNRPLVKLMDWFQQRHYFEVYNDQYLNGIRTIRNILAHPTEHMFSGPHGRNIIEGVLDLINGLYEDPVLRKERMELTTKIINQIHTYQSGVKCKINRSIYFAFNAWPAFINNKITPHEIYFYFNPTFSIPEDYLFKSNWVIPPVIVFEGNAINFTASSIEIIDNKGERLMITEIDDEKEREEFKDWVNNNESYCQPGMGYFYPEEKITDTFSFHLRNFYKI